eukprot:1196043-Prorocentrum_minimum.AAC.1
MSNVSSSSSSSLITNCTPALTHKSRIKSSFADGPVVPPLPPDWAAIAAPRRRGRAQKTLQHSPTDESLRELSQGGPCRRATSGLGA